MPKRPLNKSREKKKPAAKQAASKTAKPKRAFPNPDLARIVEILADVYADAECALRHKNAFELLIATILSAQCTDERVNIVTKDLFAKYPTPAALAAVPIKQLEKLIQSTGFF